MKKTDGDEAETSAGEPAAKVSRHIRPLGPRVLVRVIKQPDRSEAGLFLPAGVKDAHSAALFGEVVEVARTMPKSERALTEDERDDDDDDRKSFGTNVSGVPLGANVLFEKERGVVVPWDESLRILEVRYVLAIVDVIPQEEIQ
ncbi:MAG TPA: co-chaperone GroES family protein [Nannocystaceae bacterium]|nr:co-chaperone GroES family protein [Nannocystaceae bacterium]